MARSYEQSCFIARALDVLGERWTLLIVRELTLGPRRYGELLGALPGIGNSLLAGRLRHLEQYGVVRRTGPAGAGAYELGDRGQALVPLLGSLVDWGAALGKPPPGYADRTAWRLVAMRLTASGEAVRFPALTQLVVDEETFWLHADGERVRLEIGQAPISPDLRLTCGKNVFTSLAWGRLTVELAVATGELLVDGDPDTARSFFEVFSMPGGDEAVNRP
jgi:DNA-binding HxlR family transcriptional regulator